MKTSDGETTGRFRKREAENYRCPRLFRPEPTRFLAPDFALVNRPDDISRLMTNDFTRRNSCGGRPYFSAVSSIDSGSVEIEFT